MNETTVNYSIYSINEDGILIMNSCSIFEDFNNKTFEEFQIESTIHGGDVWIYTQYEIYGVNEHCLLHACNIMRCNMKRIMIGRCNRAFDKD